MTAIPSINRQPLSCSRRQLLVLGLMAALIRLAVFCTASVSGHLSLAAYTAKADSTSYIAYASALAGERRFQSLDKYDRRVFPGYPLLIAAVHRVGVPLAVAALIVTWASAGVAASAAAVVFEDFWIGLALVFLIPHYLINSSLAMSEARLLALSLSALWLIKAERPWLAGIAFGFSLIVGPMGCFALAGALVFAIAHRRWKSASIVAGVSLLVFVLAFVTMQIWTGDALQGVRIYAHHPGAYGGRMFLWPFESLITTPLHEPTAVGRIVYTWIHVVITLGACAIVTQRVIVNRAAERPDVISFLWLVGNTLLVLCIGSSWGFRHFPRFTIPASPAMFWVLRRWLPRNWVCWVVIGALCFVSAVAGVRNSP